MSNAYYDNLPEEQFTLRSRILRIPNLKLIEKIGDGGMASVWKAWDIPKQRLVAVKILSKEFASDGIEVRHFREEERLMEELHHEGIVQAYDFNNGNGNWYYVMEYVDGYTFAQLVKRKQHVKEADCLLICESVAAALNYAWNEHGLVHCDLKPENIMINTQGVIKLTDLGISHRFEEPGEKEVPDHILGTPAYISPEQVYGDVELDCRSDIYSLAATLFHLSTGRLLFPGLDNDNMMRAQCNEESQAHDPRAYRPELSEGFCQLLEAMLVKNRDYRVSDWESVFAMCREVEAGQSFKPREDLARAASSIKLL